MLRRPPKARREQFRLRIGCHCAAYVEPRATADLDLVVDDRRLHSLLAAIERELGPQDPDDIGAAVRLRGIHVDLIKASSGPLFREAVATAEEREPGWFLPPLELLMVLKFMAAVSPWRGRDRNIQDAADLARLALSRDADGLDRGRIRHLAGLVYGGAAAELDTMLDRIQRGESIQV